MTTHNPHLTITGARRQLLRLVVGAVAILATFALYDAAGGAEPGTVPGWASVRLADVAVSPQEPPGLTGGVSAADDDGDEDQLQQQQLAQQQLKQSMQQAEQQNEQAQEQFNQDMQQQRTYGNQFNKP